MSVNKKKPIKVFNDPIHGHIELHPILVKIIDTPQFQRLRNIKQLGGCYHVYPGACHNRFEHSIGVCHLAGQWLRSMKENQPELNITDDKTNDKTNDVLCVEIAGLCHDMGHGPFSHAFDAMFIPKANPGSKWKHEQGSLDMIKHMLEVNKDLKKDLEDEFGEEYERNMTLFIPELINGPNDKSDTSKKWKYKGRTEEKSFLYEIVANKETGVDVDKWDYFARDAYHLGMKSSFDHLRYMKFSRVIKADEDGRKHICMRDKESDNLYDMFYTRYCLHRRAYQHKTNNAIEMMITAAMLKADEHLEIKPGVKMSDTIKNMDAYTLLTDNVYYQILHSTDEKMKEAKDILENVEKRNIYKCVGTAIYKKQDDKTKGEKTKDKIKEEIVDIAKKAGESLNQEDIEVDLVTFDYGMKDKDPIKNMFFFEKEVLDKAMIKLPKSKVSQFKPMVFTETHLRVYSKDKEKKEKVGEYYDEWFKKNQDLFNEE